MVRPAIRASLSYIVILAALVFAFSNSVCAHQAAPDDFIATTPFSTWLGTGPKPQIRWHVQLLPTELSYYQRIHLCVLAKIPGREVLRHIPAGGLAFMVQVTDQHGRMFQDHTLLEPQLVEKGVKKGDLEISENMLVDPGTYSIALALYDQKTGEYSFDERRVNVPTLKSDSLPASWPADAGVQFFDPRDSGFKILLSGHVPPLNLPVHNTRPVHLDVILNFAPSRHTARSTSYYDHEQLVYFNALAELAGLGFTQGSVSVEIVDPDLHKVLFEQSDARQIDWPRLRGAIETVDPTRIDVNALEHRGDDERFLAGAIQARLDRAIRTSKDDPRPLNVFVIVSDPADYAMQNAPSPLSLAPGDDSVVFYVSIRQQIIRAGRRGMLYPSVFSNPGEVRQQDTPVDDIAALLVPLKPMTFEVTSPESMREALANLISNLGQH